MDRQAAFVASVLQRVGPLADARDAPGIKSTAIHLYLDGFTEDDAVRYLRCTEEVSPDLPEETALKRMAALRAKYPCPYDPRNL